MFEACVIGCGEIGSEVLKELAKVFGKDYVAGVDVNVDTLGKLYRDGITACYPEQMPDAKVYIISLWSTNSMIETGALLKDKNPDFIFIESTVDPYLQFEIELAFEQHWHKLLYFPHRFNPNDPVHHIFNQPRLLAAASGIQATVDNAAIWLIEKVGMRPSDIIDTTPHIAILAKVVENTYRAMEIIMAQELASLCKNSVVDFEELRKAVNTKWNIDIREAKDGVKGKCLPKDLALFNNFFPNNMIFKLGELLNKQYINDYRG